MKQYIGIFIFINLAILLTPALFAQEHSDLEPHINEVWTGFTIKKELSKKFRLEFEDQLRISDAYNGVRLNFLELGLNYNVIKGVDVNAKYRYSFRNDIRNTRRLTFDLSYKLKIKSIKADIKYRFRFQNTRVIYTGESVNFVRNKITFNKTINKKWTGYTSYEAFHNLNDEFEHQANRFVLGAKYKLNKRIKLKAFVQYDQDIHGKYQPTRSVFGLMGTYQFK